MMMMMIPIFYSSIFKTNDDDMTPTEWDLIEEEQDRIS